MRGPCAIIHTVRSRIQTVVLTPEVGEFAEEVLQAFNDLPATPDGASPIGECSPAVDVTETEQAIHITVDVPGVRPTSIRVVVKGSAVLIVGEKAPRRRIGAASFHLVERDFGRFVRLVRFTAPCESGRAVATLRAGELHVELPKRPDRRGRPIWLPLGGGEPE